MGIGPMTTASSATGFNHTDAHEEIFVGYLCAGPHSSTRGLTNGIGRFQRLLFPGLAAAAPPAYKNGQLRL
jgi:hypothetical protein